MPALYEEVKEHSIKVLSNVYKIKDIHRLEEIMASWEKNKKWFLDKFEKPIVKIAENITSEIDEESKRELICKCAKKVRDYAWEHNEDISAEIRHEIDYYLTCELSNAEFFNNILETDKTHTSKGIKTAKAIKKIFPENPTEAQKAHILRIQMIMSEFQQKNKIHGDLYLSVHPVDFLTISTNNHNWTSCHGLYHAYSAGNIAYIQDQATCIAYLVTPGKEHVTINKRPELGRWNDKTWRMLIFVNEDVHLAAAGRHYPSENIILEEKAMEKIVPIHNYWRISPSFRRLTFYDRLTDEHNTAPYYLDQDQRQVYVSGNLIPLKELITLNDQRLSEDSRFYCDVIDSSCYTPRFYSNFSGWEDRSNIAPIRIGHLGCGCLVCGADANCENYALPFCKDCFYDYDKTDAQKDWWTCAGCGYQEHYSLQEPMIADNDCAYCRDCYDREEDEF